MPATMPESLCTFKGQDPLGHGKMALIEREFHIDNLAAKALIGIDILKPERMAIGLERDLIRLGSCAGLQVLVQVHTRGKRITTSVYAKSRTTIPARTNLAVPVSDRRHRSLQLPRDRDFIFEPSVLEELSPYAYIVDTGISHVFIRNDIDHDVVLARNQNTGIVSEHKLAGCFPVNLTD